MSSGISGRFSVREIAKITDVNTRLLCLCVTIGLSTATLFSQGLDTHQQKGDWEEVNFAFDQSVLTDGYPSLLRLAELLQQNPDHRVNLRGYTDHFGPDSYNMELGNERAETVRAFLVKYGAQASQITIETYGEDSPAADNDFGEGQWMNRRVTITVTDAGGNVISDQGARQAIASLDDSTKAQEGCCNEILKELEKLDDILAALETLKDENQALKDDIDKLKQAQRRLETDLAAAAQPPAEAQSLEIVREETPQPSTKYSRYNLMAGPNTQDGNLTVSAQGQVFLPFGGRHAVQAQGDFMHGFQRDEGQLDFGIVNRFGPLQAGVFSSFKYVRFGEFSHAGGLGAGSWYLRLRLPSGPGWLVWCQGFRGRVHPE